MNKHVEYSDQQLGNKEVKLIKVGTIKLISLMTLALKVIVMFTLSMGTLFFESARFIEDFKHMLWSCRFSIEIWKES